MKGRGCKPEGEGIDKRERVQTRGWGRAQTREGGRKLEEEGMDKRETEYSFRSRRVERVLI
jgi:hypothetical protein